MTYPASRPPGVGPARWIVGSVGLALWGICFVRAALFLLATRQTYADEWSINAWNDVVYAGQILICYAVGAGAGAAAFACWIRHRGGRIVWVPLLGSLISVVYLVLRKPEEVIVFIPGLSPLLSLALCLASWIAALAWMGISRALVGPVASATGRL